MKTELIDELKSIVQEINSHSTLLKEFSNDELRTKIWAIEATIGECENKAEKLDQYLPEVFAIVKETARRFTLGSLDVTANGWDKHLSQKYDFVQLDGDRAVYSNQWEVGGHTVPWTMIHYDEQLMGGYLLHRGYAVEMATGEGKTLVATLPVFLNALAHEGVHLMTINDYLSKRDLEITRPLYMFFGLSADCIELYERYDSRHKDAYRADITFGTNSSFTFDYLFDHLALSADECVQQKHTFAIIDEIDSILIDDADEPHIVGGRAYYDIGKQYQENIDLIKELITDTRLFETNELDQSANFTQEGKKWIEAKTGLNDLYAISKTYEVKEFETLPAEEKEKIYKRLNLQNTLYQLLLALTVYEADVDYVIEGKSIKIIDQHTGRIKESCRWEHGLHTAMEIKEGLVPQKDSDSMAVISLKNYFRLYHKVCGMSGTIMPVEQELKEIYGLQCAAIPTHKPCIRKDLPLRIYKTQKDKDVAILEQIKENRKNGRPTLIGSISLKRSAMISQQLDDNGIPHQKLDAKTTKTEAQTVAHAGYGNTVTVSTSVAGRGTDIKPSNDALSNGGLMVIGTDLFESVRVDRQLKGRTGRQGNPGTSVFYVSLEDFILKNLTSEERKNLEAEIDRIAENELNTPNIRGYFEKAQSNREMFFRNRRKETARKDDIIAPHRRKFYDQRNELLYDVSISESIISDVISRSARAKNEFIEDHLKELYQTSCELARRYTFSNKVNKKTEIPFSDNRFMFCITLDTTLVQTSYQYFAQEYKRQILLQVYDKQWKKFVLYLMSNLDKNEIEQLEDKYAQMMTEIDNILISRLTNANIPVKIQAYIQEDEDIQEKNNGLPHPTKHLDKIEAEDPCPCGSGKKYCECHGGARSNIVHRRRR